MMTELLRQVFLAAEQLTTEEQDQLAAAMQARLPVNVPAQLTAHQIMRLSLAERHARLAKVASAAADEFRTNPELTEFADPQAETLAWYNE